MKKTECLKKCILFKESTTLFLFNTFFISYICACASDPETKETFDQITNKEIIPSIEWIKINKGAFVFGSAEDIPCRGPIAEKQVPVTLTRSFLIAATEVTQAQWQALDFPNPSKNLGADKPVTFINFYETLVWCNKLSLLEGLDTCYDLSSCTNPVGTGCNKDDKWGEEGCWDKKKVFNCTGEIHKYKDWYACPGYRLPTTAEWEYAAKAGTTTNTWAGDIDWQIIGECIEQPALEDIAWYCHNSGGELHPVAQKQPNPWGLYDTLGNALEWVDYFSDGQPLNWNRPDQSLIDPTGPLSGDSKDLRGGSFSDSSCLIHPSWQTATRPTMRVFDSSFRPVRTILE
ncbi:MAG: formylglycine-generating enzyme family protein [Proteobacteria bacterium]|nr:formylglycine-generating enzyme family protein [Pseudomonadota bacterium]